MHIEPLETRIAPATLVGQVLTYTDVDGDKVTITFSSGTLTAGMFAFDTGLVDGDTTTRQQLQAIDVGSAAGISGAAITMKVKRAAEGDGFADVGRLTAAGVDLGKVTLKGDLGGFEVGSGTAGTPALASLNVQSMGILGTSTQASPNLQSVAVGAIGALKVAGDLQDVFIRTTQPGELGTIGAITIGGSLIGGAEDNSGLILAQGDIGPVKIGRDLRGGSGDESGKIESRGGAIASVTIGGAISSSLGEHDTFTDLGGAVHSGQLYAFTTLGQVKVARDVTSSISISSVAIHGRLGVGTVSIGGSIAGRHILSEAGLGAVKIAGDVSGNITATGDIASATIGRVFQGNLHALGGGDLGAVKIGGSVGVGGQIVAEGNLAKLSIGGLVQVDAIIRSTGDMGTVTIGGDVARAEISSGANLAGLLIGGSWDSLTGGFPASQKLNVAGTLKLFKIGGDFTFGGGSAHDVGRIDRMEVGGAFAPGNFNADSIGTARFGSFNAFLSVSGDLGNVTVTGDFGGGSVTVFGDTGAVKIGGTGRGVLNLDAASVTIGRSLLGALNGTFGAVKIGGDLLGSLAATAVDRIAIGGSMLADSVLAPAIIAVTGTIGKFSLRGDLRGGGIINGGDNFPFGSVSADRIGSVTIGGSIVGGTDDRTVAAPAFRSGFIESGHEIGAIKIGGELRGTVGANGNVTQAQILAGTGLATPTSNLAIKSLTIGGTVERAGIHAGSSDGNAQIGAVKVGRDWIASSLTAGIRDVNGNGFGNADDDVVNLPPGAETDGIVARIASVAIKGRVLGSSTPGDHFGFVAQQIGAFKMAGFTAPLTSGTDAPLELALLTDDVTIREI